MCTPNTVYCMRVRVCNSYDLSDHNVEVGEMFDVLMDNATMKLDFIKTLFTLLKMSTIRADEWGHIIQTFFT